MLVETVALFVDSILSFVDRNAVASRRPASIFSCKFHSNPETCQKRTLKRSHTIMHAIMRVGEAEFCKSASDARNVCIEKEKGRKGEEESRVGEKK